MANAQGQQPKDKAGNRQAPTLAVAPSPHLSESTFTTRRMMVDVLVGLLPAVLVAIFLFRHHAVVVVGLSVAACLAAEALFSFMRGRRPTLCDGSAVVTGMILGLSLPWSAPWYTMVIGGFAAIGLGKAVFGGLGYNLFNPAMVGRAFIMLSFARSLGGSAYVAEDAAVDVMTRATPMTAAKEFASAMMLGLDLDAPEQLGLGGLFLGSVNGSLGEVSALALLIGGLYLCWRRSASWEIALSMVAAVALLGGLGHWMNLTPLSATGHVLSGAVMLGAFFIATDPVTSPLTPLGKAIFGAGVGALTIMLRLFSSYPEGVMFAVLLMNALTPLINQWTIPRPVGGPAAPRAQ